MAKAENSSKPKNRATVEAFSGRLSPLSKS
jgi:hypothetical protein